MLACLLACLLASLLVAQPRVRVTAHAQQQALRSPRGRRASFLALTRRERSAKLSVFSHSR
eukprot:1045130-Prorocentrum_lima.AAC.1